MTVEGGGAQLDPAALPAVAVEQARAELAQGGVTRGAALVGPDGAALAADAIGGPRTAIRRCTPGPRRSVRRPGRRGYGGTAMTMVTTLSPCWYYSGLVRQFGIGRVVTGEARTLHGGHDRPAHNGVQITVEDDPECVGLVRGFIAERPALWHEGIGRAE